MIKKVYQVSGMHCPSCAMFIEGELEDKGAKARCSYAKQLVEVEYDPDRLTEADIKTAIARAGYALVGTKS